MSAAFESIPTLQEMLINIGVKLETLEQHLHGYEQEFIEVQEAFRTRYNEPDFNLLAECSRSISDHKVFLQTLLLPVSTDARLITLRLIRNGFIRRFQVHYEHMTSLQMEVVLDPAPHEQALIFQPDVFQLDHPQDFALLGRLSMAVTPDNKPLIFGPVPWA